MGYYVDILKVSEDSEHVIYEFGPDKETLGKLRLNKFTREYQLLREVPGGITNPYCAKTLIKLFELLDNNKEFPEYLFYCSGR
ncbi:hypothetical protein [Marinicrinis sediminis]|uniref:Uncharacterized protein n=1 Tax=Marinicrinis sediminis TaxID=1652465 RepID=A0ABW5R671_9BACL